MPCQRLGNCLRIVVTEIRQFATQEFVPGETDAKALDQIQDLLSSQPARKERKGLKDIYVLLIWNMDLGVDVTTWGEFEHYKELGIQTLRAEDIEILSRIQNHLQELPTSWDRQQSKWTYVSLIRNMEPERVCEKRGSRLTTVSSSADTTKSATPNNTVEPMPSDIQQQYDDLTSQLTASVESGALGAAQVKKLKTALHGMYLIAARNELAISSLRDALASCQESFASLHSTVNNLAAEVRGGKVDGSGHENFKDLHYGRSRNISPVGNDGRFVFFDDA